MRKTLVSMMFLLAFVFVAEKAESANQQGLIEVKRKKQWLRTKTSYWFDMVKKTVESKKSFWLEKKNSNSSQSIQILKTLEKRARTACDKLKMMNHHIWPKFKVLKIQKIQVRKIPKGAFYKWSLRYQCQLRNEKTVFNINIWYKKLCDRGGSRDVVNKRLRDRAVRLMKKKCPVNKRFRETYRCWYETIFFTQEATSRSPKRYCTNPSIRIRQYIWARNY